MSLKGITVHYQMHLLFLMYKCHLKESLYTTECTCSFLCTNVTERNHCTLPNALALSYVRMSLKGITVHYQMHLLFMYECHSKDSLYTIKCSCSFLCMNVTQRNHCTLSNAVALSYVRMSLKGLTVHYQMHLLFLMYECHSKDSLHTIKCTCSFLCTNVTQRTHAGINLCSHLHPPK